MRSSICGLDPTAIPKARSFLLIMAVMTATECSATLPTNATRITPTKNFVTPHALAAWSYTQTCISLNLATNALTTAGTTIEPERL